MHSNNDVFNEWKYRVIFYILYTMCEGLIIIAKVIDFFFRRIQEVTMLALVVMYREVAQGLLLLLMVKSCCGH